jgi:hypothetical protein
MTYQPFLLTEELHITQIITIHYFEYTNTYHFHGESHDFWEFLCVDKGEVTVTAGEKKLTLQQGQIIFHEPNEFHNVQANGKIAPNLVVISFSCDSSCMKQFRNLITTISETEKTFLPRLSAKLDTVSQHHWIIRLPRKWNGEPILLLPQSR